MKRPSTIVITSIAIVVLLCAMIMNNVSGGKMFARLRAQLLPPSLSTAASPAVLQAEASSNQYGFTKVIPGLLRALSNTGLSDAADTPNAPGATGPYTPPVVGPDGIVGPPAVPRPGDGGVEIHKIINAASSHFGIPAKMLEGAMRTECGGKFGASDADILAWSAEGAGIPPSGNEWVSHCYSDTANKGMGPAQFNGEDNFLQYAQLANKISGLNRTRLNVNNMVDSIYAAALKLALDHTDMAAPTSITPQEFVAKYKTAPWACPTVRQAAICYQQGCAGLPNPDELGLKKLRTMWYFYVDGNYDAGENTIKKATPC